MTRLARYSTLAAIALLGGALSINFASAQQEQSGRSDRSSARDSSGQYQSDQSRDSNGQSDQRRRSDSGQSSERSQRQATDRSASTDQYRNQQTDQYRGQQSGNYRGQSARDQSGRSQQEDVAWLGVFLSENDRNQGNQQGAMVTQVYPAGPAARAGLRPGDLITSVDGQSVSSSSDLITAIEQHQPGSRAQLVITRNNQQMNLPLTLGSRESFMWRGQNEDPWSGQYGGGQSAGQGGQYGGGQSAGQGGQYGGQQGQWSSQSAGQHDHFANLPPFAMQLEHERRLYEQNQRIETQIAQLQNEVRQLREAIQQQQRR